MENFIIYYLYYFIIGFPIIIIVFFSRYTSLPIEKIKYIKIGETFFESLDSEDDIYTRDDLLGRWLDSFAKNFGKRFVGWSFLNYSVHTFMVDTKKRNPKAKEGQPSTWLTDDPPKMVDGLLKRIPRLFIIDKLELRDLLQVDLGIFVEFLVINQGVSFVFYYKANFSNPIDILSARVREVISNLPDYEHLINSDSSLLDKLLYEEDLQNDLARFDMKLQSIKIVFIASDEKIEEASRLKTVNKLTGEAKIIQAEAEAKVKLLLAEAEAKGLYLTEEARVSAVVLKLKSEFPDADQDELLKTAGSVLEKNALSKSGLTVLVTELFKK